MAKIIMYTKSHCPYCDYAKELLKSKQAVFQEISIDNSDEKREEMMRLSGRRTVPQIFINDVAIGGFDDLKKLSDAGKLNDLLKN